MRICERLSLSCPENVAGICNSNGMFKTFEKIRCFPCGTGNGTGCSALRVSFFLFRLLLREQGWKMLPDHFLHALQQGVVGILSLYGSGQEWGVNAYFFLLGL